MRWPAFACCAALGLVLQTTLAPRLAIAGQRPDFVFVLVVFFGLYAPRKDAYIAGWVLGLMTDLMSIERLGVFSIAYCLVAVSVSSVRSFVFLKNAVTHVIVTLLAAALVHVGLVAYRAYLYPGSIGGAGGIATEVALAAAYTALWAPLIDHLLLKGSGVLGLHTSRYSHRSSVRMRAARV